MKLYKRVSFSGMVFLCTQPDGNIDRSRVCNFGGGETAHKNADIFLELVNAEDRKKDDTIKVKILTDAYPTSLAQEVNTFTHSLKYAPEDISFSAVSDPSSKTGALHIAYIKYYE